MNAQQLDFIFNFKRMETYEIGAYLAVIITSPPGIDNDEIRERLHIALCSEFLREKSKRDSKWAGNYQRIKPIYAYPSNGAVQRDLNLIARRFDERLQAACIAIAYLKQAGSGQRPVDLPKEIKRLSLNGLIPLIDKAGTVDVSNFRRRVWKPSLPVIHLVAACAVNMSMTEKEKGILTSLGDILSNRKMIKEILREAEIYKKLIGKSLLRVKPKDLVRIQIT